MKGISIVKRIGLIIGPLLFILIYQVEGDALSTLAWKVMAVASWMVIWWITEAVPIPATALLPLVLFPLLGVFDISVAAYPEIHPDSDSYCWRRGRLRNNVCGLYSDCAARRLATGDGTNVRWKVVLGSSNDVHWSHAGLRIRIIPIYPDLHPERIRRQDNNISPAC